jgi:hypothetical protein
MRNKHWAQLIIFTIFLFATALFARVAFADPTGTAAPTSDPLGDLQRMLTAALVTAVTGAVVAIGTRAWDWIGHHTIGRALENDAAKLGLQKQLAAEAVAYVDQMAHVANAKLSDTAIEQHVKDFLAAHEVAGAAADAVRALIESQLGARRAAAEATAKLAANAKSMQDALENGQLGKDLARLRAMDEEAAAKAKAKGSAAPVAPAAVPA